MIFNLVQKYVSVFSAFFNTVLIVKFLDVEHLGLYAFLVASGEIFSVFAAMGLRSVYLREIVKHRGDLEGQRVFTVMAEVMPKIFVLIIAGVFITVARLTSLSTENAVTIAIIGTMLASGQLSSQKVRSHGLNTLAQLVVNVRPIFLTLLLLSLGLIDVETLEEFFLVSIIASFAIPAVFAYAFWFVRFRGLIFSRVDAAVVIQRAREIFKEFPGLFMLALGQKVITRSDVILVTMLLGLDAAGVYRIAAQIVTVANSSQFPIRSKFMKKYSRLLNQNKLGEAEAIARLVARMGISLFLVIFLVAAVAVYQGPYLDEIKYRQEFIWSLGILALVGLVKAGVPMIESYVVYRNNTNKGGLIQLGVVISNIFVHLILIPVFGLPGACVTALLSIFFWRFIVKRFL